MRVWNCQIRTWGQNFQFSEIQDASVFYFEFAIWIHYLEFDEFLRETRFCDAKSEFPKLKNYRILNFFKNCTGLENFKQLSNFKNYSNYLIWKNSRLSNF